MVRGIITEFSSLLWNWTTHMYTRSMNCSNQLAKFCNSWLNKIAFFKLNLSAWYKTFGDSLLGLYYHNIIPDPFSYHLTVMMYLERFINTYICIPFDPFVSTEFCQLFFWFCLVFLLLHDENHNHIALNMGKSSFQCTLFSYRHLWHGQLDCLATCNCNVTICGGVDF